MSEKRAGEEVDAEVAREVMGDEPKRDGDGNALCPECGASMWTPNTWPDEGRARCTPCSEWRYSPYREYSTDIAAAFEVVEKMEDEGFAWTIESDGTRKWWGASAWMGDEHHYAEADTAPLAICLAALQATRSPTP